MNSEEGWKQWDYVTTPALMKIKFNMSQIQQITEDTMYIIERLKSLPVWSTEAEASIERSINELLKALEKIRLSQIKLENKPS